MQLKKFIESYRTESELTSLQRFSSKFKIKLNKFIIFFQVSYLGYTNIMNIGKILNGLFKTLPPGLYSDSFKLYMFVQVFDDMDAITTFNISSPVVVTISESALVSYFDAIQTANTTLQLVAYMYGTSTSKSTSAIISLSNEFAQATALGLLTPTVIKLKF